MERITKQRQQQIFEESEREFALFMEQRTEQRRKFESKERQRINAEMEVLQARIRNILIKAGFDPNQPRVPSGNPDGGQWTAVGGGGGSSGSSSGRSKLKPNRDKSPDFEKPDNEDDLWDAIANEFDNSASAAEISKTHYVEIDGSVKPIPERWSKQDTFRKHYKDHGKDFASISGEDYVDKSQAFRDIGIKGGTNFTVLITHDDYVKIVEKETKIFGVYSPEGKTINFYRLKRYKTFENDMKRVLGKGGRIAEFPSGGGMGMIGMPGFKPRDNIPDNNLLE